MGVGVGKPWMGWELGSPSPCTLTSITPSARIPVTESELHHCPQQEALQEQLRLLEEENEQLREEVRIGERACSCAEGVDTPAPSFLPPSRSLNSTTLRRRNRYSSWIVWSSFVPELVTWGRGLSQGAEGRNQDFKSQL